MPHGTLFRLHMLQGTLQVVWLARLQCSFTRGGYLTSVHTLFFCGFSFPSIFSPIWSPANFHSLASSPLLWDSYPLGAWTLTTEPFQAAAHAASQSSVTSSEEKTISPLPHIYTTHRHPGLASVTVIAGEREYAMPPTLGLDNFTPLAPGHG